jgi:hypothetical protein
MDSRAASIAPARQRLHRRFATISRSDLRFWHGLKLFLALEMAISVTDAVNLRSNSTACVSIPELLWAAEFMLPCLAFAGPECPIPLARARISFKLFASSGI